MLPFIYEVALQLHDGSNLKFSLDEKGWAEKEQLKQTQEISLIPMPGNGLPVVACQIPKGAKPVVKTQVKGKIGVASGEHLAAFRLYAIGYKQGNYEHLVWVLPNGSIELGPESKYGDLLLGTVK